MSERPLSVLFLCTDNAARSQMAEALLRFVSKGRIEVTSAGVSPASEVHPLAKATLANKFGIDPSGLRPKAMTHVLGRSFDYVITVCDEARQECPVFPGVHESLHWGYEDPAEAEGSEDERLAVFRRVFIQLSERIGAFIPLARRHRTEVDATTLA